MNSSNPISGDRGWILTIRQAINEDIEETSDIPPSIFNVPITLVSTKPECYIPQQVALGPYHHCRPELYEMERYKLSAAKRCQKQMQDSKIRFQEIVDQTVIFEPKIRACYHKFLNFDSETLAWMMALDVSFLLEFLDVYNIKKERFKFKSHSSESVQKSLTSILLGLHKDLSPFTVLDQECNLQSSEDYTHVLGFLYHMIIDPNIKQQWNETTDEGHDEEQAQETRHKFQRIIDGTQNFVKRMISSEPVKGLVKLPLAIASNIPIVCNASGPLILTRYIELMNGIIDTKEDARLLREMGIIKNRLKTDEEIANLLNGMSRRTLVNSLEEIMDIVKEEAESSTRKTCRQIVRDRIAASDCLMTHYFNDDAVYVPAIFRRRFRMHKPIFLHIVNDIVNVSSFIRQGCDARAEGFTLIQKCAAAIRHLEEFCECIIFLYKKRYLRKPTITDVPQLYAHHAEVHGFPGMLGSLDCMYWDWGNCPVRYQEQYTRGGKRHPTLVLEAVALQDLWI
ncbi:hypothetical protein LXL04_032048 [Taraxacum kok-saghyz]